MGSPGKQPSPSSDGTMVRNKGENKIQGEKLHQDRLTPGNQTPGISSFNKRSAFPPWLLRGPVILRSQLCHQLDLWLQIAQSAWVN